MLSGPAMTAIRRICVATLLAIMIRAISWSGALRVMAISYYWSLSAIHLYLSAMHFYLSAMHFYLFVQNCDFCPAGSTLAHYPLLSHSLLPTWP